MPTLSIDCPDSLVAGSQFTARVSLTNDGAVPWGFAYKLGSQQPQDGTLWGTNRLLLPSVMSPGSSTEFTVTLRAPIAAQGPLPFAWRMVQEGVAWFGPVFSKTLIVTPADQPIVPSGPPIGSLVLDGWTPTGWRKV